MFARPIFPSPIAPGSIEEPLGFAPSFAPRDYSQRTSGRGQVIEHGPEPRLYIIDLASNPRVDLSMRATSRRTRRTRSACVMVVATVLRIGGDSYRMRGARLQQWRTASPRASSA